MNSTSKKTALVTGASSGIGQASAAAWLPPVRFDMFYHRRVLDMPDSVPKYSGNFRSELAVGKMIMSGL